MAGRHTNYFKRKALGDVAAAARYHQLHLFQNAFDPNDDSETADFTEADYSGYSVAALTMGTPFLNSDDEGQCNAASVTFARGAGPTSNDIWGVFITDADGNVTFYEKFGASVAMATEGEDVVEYQFSPTSQDA